MKSIRLLSFLLVMLLVSCSGKNVHAETTETAGRKSTVTRNITFIELGSVNCIPCKAMVPVMEQIEQELGDQVKVIFYDVWTAEGKPYGQQYKVRVIPTQVILNADGIEVYRHEGYFPIEELYPVLAQAGVELP